jgi:hypothetical protein
MKQPMQPLTVRLSALELLVNETGLADELNARKRAELDERRVALADELDALPKAERELAGLAKEATRANEAFAAAAAACHEAERAMKQAIARSVIATMTRQGARQRILTDLERAAPPELADALDDLCFADTLLRFAVRTDVAVGRNWLGQRVESVTSNMNDIDAARNAIAEGDRAIRELAHDGRKRTAEMVARCAELLATALEPAFAFIPSEKWALRHARPGTDFIAEIAGYMQ